MSCAPICLSYFRRLPSFPMLSVARVTVVLLSVATAIAVRTSVGPKRPDPVHKKPDGLTSRPVLPAHTTTVLSGDAVDRHGVRQYSLPIYRTRQGHGCPWVARRLHHR